MFKGPRRGHDNANATRRVAGEIVSGFPQISLQIAFVAGMSAGLHTFLLRATPLLLVGFTIVMLQVSLRPILLV